MSSHMAVATKEQPASMRRTKMDFWNGMEHTFMMPSITSKGTGIHRHHRSVVMANSCSVAWSEQPSGTQWPAMFKKSSCCARWGDTHILLVNTEGWGVPMALGHGLQLLLPSSESRKLTPKVPNPMDKEGSCKGGITSALIFRRRKERTRQLLLKALATAWAHASDQQEWAGSSLKHHPWSGLPPALPSSQSSPFCPSLLFHSQGVRIPALGSFDVVPKWIQVGDEAVIIQRPVFRLARSLAGVHNLRDNKDYLPGNKELEPLKYAKVAAAASVSRRKVEACIQGTMSLLSHCLGKGENVALVLRDIGLLLIEGMRVQMKFFYNFLERMSGKENLEKAAFEVPQLLDMVVSQVVPVASLTFSGRVIIFPEFELEFVPKPPPRAPVKHLRKVPGEDKRKEEEVLPALRQGKKGKAAPGAFA
ncbi:hypothetical protein QYF61_016242 [Mycteria americana]|uniref:CCDC81 HU domain-containing protein n=1 Tax=Mycteria americana TaxID=33587 RepID=A0AAN7MYF0_MYCAM|nr:hypothetical protein QYF61_016242 [Mycteria americana]